MFKTYEGGNLMKKIVIVGLGNAGSQVANKAAKTYPDLWDCIYVNSSEADLAMVDSDEALKFKIGDRDQIEGSGKNRAKMKEDLKTYEKKVSEWDDYVKSIEDRYYKQFSKMESAMTKLNSQQNYISSMFGM